MKTLFVFFIFSILALPVFSQDEDAILGTWISSRATEKIEFYKKDNKYFGRLMWLKDSVDQENKPLKDIHNRDADSRTHPLIGIDLFKNLTYGRRNMWRGGTAYDPSSGRSYNCEMALKDSSTLNVRKYYGIIIIGRTETWKRIPE